MSCKIASHRHGTSLENYSVYKRDEYIPKSKNCPKNYCLILVEYSAAAHSEAQVVRETYYTFLGVESSLDYVDGKSVRVTGLAFSNVIFLAFGLVGAVMLYSSDLLNSLFGMETEQIESFGWALIFSTLLSIAVRMIIDLTYIQSGLKEYTVK